MSVTFVTSLPSAKRGRRANPERDSVKAALSKKPGVWAAVESNVDAKTANRFAASLRAVNVQSSVRKNADGTSTVYARVESK